MKNISSPFIFLNKRFVKVCRIINLLTVLESIQKSTEYLEKKGIESPRINAELLLAGILKCTRIQLYLQYEKPLSDEEIVTYRDFIQRRGRFEPVQYILGSTEFYGLKFKINSSVLIPRQETEILVETILENANKNETLRIIDIGCGCGCIGISLLVNLPNSILTALDNLPGALQIATENIGSHKLNDRTEIHNIDLFEEGWAEKTDKFDLIVSNPPYVSREEYPELQKEIVLFEPQSAVTDFSDGFTYYRRICELSRYLLKPGGSVFFEVAINGAEQVKEIMEQYEFKNIDFKKDYLNINRVVFGEKA